MSSNSPIPFSHSYHGANVELSMDCLTARRAKSYNQGLVLSAAPLEDDQLYQVEVKELSARRFAGCLRIGVTSLPLEVVAGWKYWTADTDSTGQSTVLDRTVTGRLCVCSKGSKMEFPHSRIDLMSLTEGESLGVLCSKHGGIKFFINGKLAAHFPSEAPSPRFAMVDLYGPVTAIKALPLEWVYSSVMTLMRMGGLPKEVRSAGIRCEYFERCRRFLSAQRHAIPDAHFNWSHCKCYCTECYDPETQAKVKSAGHPREEYAVPIGWTKFGLWVPKRAEVLEVFDQWHVCYHGTPVDIVAPILECGQLMIRGDKSLPHHQPVPSPKNHFHEAFKPDRYNIEQIFLSPSLHYCTHGEVYAGTQRCVDSSSGKMYTGKVAFQLRVHPQACVISQQTTQSTNTRIDPCIPNDKLEWATEFRCSTVLCALLVKLQEAG